MSSVYYKFKSQKSESRIPIDGTGISVFELKREIILANGLEKVLDIDLQIFNQAADEGNADLRLCLLVDLYRRRISG
jgi:protein MPE1